MPVRDSKLIGSLRPRGEGRWQSQVRIPGTNKTVSKTWQAATLAEARRLHAQWVADAIGGKVGPAGPTLEQHLTLWLRRQHHQPATARAYRGAAKRLTNLAGTVRLRDLTPRRCDDLLADLASRHRPKTCEVTRTVLNQALSWAVVRGEIPSNPLAHLGRTPNPNASSERQAVTTEQIQAIIAAEPRTMWRCYWQTLAGTGARQGEINALRWGDIDLAGHAISISRTMTLDAKGRRVVGRTTKNAAGVRTVHVHASVAAALAGWRQELAGRNLGLAAADGYVFSVSAGGPLTADSVRWAWRRALAQAGVEAVVTPHSVRHWAGSTMLRAGQDPHIVAKMLGHSIGELMRTYGRHIPADMERRALDGLPDVGVGLPVC